MKLRALGHEILGVAVSVCPSVRPSEVGLRRHFVRILVRISIQP